MATLLIVSIYFFFFFLAGEHAFSFFLRCSSQAPLLRVAATSNFSASVRFRRCRFCNGVFSIKTSSAGRGGGIGGPSTARGSCGAPLTRFLGSWGFPASMFLVVSLVQVANS